MNLTVEAVYENGHLKLTHPIVLPEGTPVLVTITPVDKDYDPLEAVIGIGDGPPDGADNHDKYIDGKDRP